MRAEYSAREPVFFTPLELLTDRWRLQRVELRRQLLHLLSCELLPVSMEETNTLASLCTDLIDYVSIGHFEVYGRILRSYTVAGEYQILLRHILQSIGQTTDAVLAFNERFEKLPASGFNAQLAEDLGKLSRCLLLRFALEEQLLELASTENSPHAQFAAVPHTAFPRPGSARGNRQESARQMLSGN